MRKINYFIDGIYYSKLWKFMMKDHLPFQYVLNWNNLEKYIFTYLSEKENCPTDEFYTNEKALYFPHSIERSFNEKFFESLINNNITIKYSDNGRKNTIEHLFTWDTATSYYETPFDYAVFIIQNNEYIPIIEGLRREGVKSVVLFLSDISKDSGSLLKAADYSLDFEYLFNVKNDIEAKSVFIRRIIDNNVRESDKRFYKYLKSAPENKQFIFYVHRSLRLQLNIKRNILIASDIELNSEIENPIKLILYTYDGLKYYRCFRKFEEFKEIISSGIEIKNNVETLVIDATSDSQYLIEYYFNSTLNTEFISFPVNETKGTSKKDLYKTFIENEKNTAFHELKDYTETIKSIKFAFDNQTVISGHIEKTVNGGYTVNIGQGIKGFLPLGKADSIMISDLESLIGVTSSFYVEELVLGEKFNLVLNRKNYVKKQLLKLKEDEKNQ